MTLIREASQFQHHYSNKSQATSIESFTHTVSQQALHTAETLQNKILTTMTKNTDAKYQYEGA